MSSSPSPTSPADSSKKPRAERPQSILASNFADQLNDIFLINDTLDELSQSVENKRFSLTTHNLELTALEARLKRTEELLEQKKKRLSLPHGATSPPPMPKSPPPPPPVAEEEQPQQQTPGGSYVVIERSPSVVNAGVPPMPTRRAPPVPIE
ncbi:hypothetical protein DFH27DRAFT_222255 [Peziza echinospora]|nr:hypothetical protein DFH27DRAFT_222255 [Peziza echinospora]